jgi:hypothetical protein
MRRYWILAMVITVGVAPGAFSGCFQLYGEKVNFLETATLPLLSQNPPGIVTQNLNMIFNPLNDPTWQQILNTGYAALQVVISSEIRVETPQNWVDVGKPR